MMRKWAIGCAVLIGVWILLVAGVLGWFLRTPDIQTPPREYPPNNAYDQYRTIGEAMRRCAYTNYARATIPPRWKRCNWAG